MDRNKIKRLLEELEHEVSKDEALVRIHKQPVPYGNIILGNQKGLLRFGIHAIREAVHSKSKNIEWVESFKTEELAYLQGDELEEFLFVRNDKIEKLTLEQSQEQTRLAFNKPARLYIYWFIAIFCVFLVIGVYTSVNWIFEFFGWNL